MAAIWATSSAKKIDSKNVVGALRREKTLLQQVLQLAECQLDLIQTGRIEDLNVLLSLREAPMRELALSELNVGAEISQLGADRALTAKEIKELHYLNLEITDLADRIAAADTKAEQLAESCEFYFSSEDHTPTEVE
jgi:hypothetical protein